MKKILTLVFISLAAVVNGQGVWTQKADLGGMKRYAATGFSIGNKGYIGLGLHYETLALLNDFWEYDPANNAWTQVADFGGTARMGCTDFVIGNVAYVGVGTDSYSTGYNFRNDFWMYDPSLNTWTQVADFAGDARYSATGFAIGTDGYLCLGYSPNFYNDLWQYNSITDTWLQKTNFPGTARQAGVSFTLGGNGYVGSGVIGNGNGPVFNDFYKYDTASDSWSQIADLPSIEDGLACFVILGKAYVGCGTSTYPNSTVTNHWWSYDTASNVWSPIANMGGTLRASAVGFEINKKGYCGTGAYNSFLNTLNDFWEYSFDSLATSITKITNQLTPTIHISSHVVTITTNNQEPSAVTLYDITGRKLLHQSFAGSTSLNIESLAKGIYFAEITNGKESVVKKLFKE